MPRTRPEPPTRTTTRGRSLFYLYAPDAFEWADENHDEVMTLYHKEAACDDDLRRLLELGLGLRSVCVGPTKSKLVSGDLATLASLIARRIVKGLCGWFAPTGSDQAAWKRLYSPECDLATVAACRRELLAWLEAAPNVPPPHMMGPLRDGLSWANDGSGRIPPLFHPVRKRGHSVDPAGGRFWEATLLCWVAYEVGRGRPAKEALAEVAEAVGLSTSAVDGWRAAWLKREGRQHVAEELAEYRKRGRAGRLFKAPGYDLSYIVRR